MNPKTSAKAALALAASVLFTVIFCGNAAIAQDKSLVFSKLRQLPDLGACPSDGTSADPDLQKALKNALAQARSQAKDMVDTVARMKDAGLASPEVLKQLDDSAGKLNEALKNSDDCAAARAFAQQAPVAPAAGVVTAAPPLTPGGTCERNAPPCINQPFEGDPAIQGKLALAAGAKASESNPALKIGSQTVPIQDAADSGEFKQTVSALNSYNTVELVQLDANKKPATSGAIAVNPSVTCDKAGGRRPCLNTPHAGDTQVSGEVAVADTKLAPDTKVKVSVNGVEVGDPVAAKSENNKFTFKKDGLDPLAANSKVQVDQVPPVKGSANTTGPVLVQKATGLRDEISISTDTLDFGHQSMQTASDAKPVTVTNNSGQKLTLQLLTSTEQPKDFQVSGCQNPIENGQQCSFNVTFAPFSPKLREKYVALVPSAASQTFESLRKDLNDKEVAAAGAEEDWRREARCADEAKPDKDCPTTKATHESAHEKSKTYQSKQDEVAQARANLSSQFKLISLKAVPDHWKFPFTRAVVGVDVSAPTSNTVKQSYFVDFDLLAPMKVPFVKKNEDPLENRFWVWLNPRVTSLPQATNFSAVSTINETGSFFDSVSNGKLNDIANGLDVNGGLEFALIKPRDGIPWWGEYVNTQARLSPSLIFGFGVSTPFSTNSTEVKSEVTQAICDAFKAPSGQTVSNDNGLFCGIKDGKAAIKVPPNPDITGDDGFRSFIDFFPKDRSRFFRRYYTGLRFKTYFFSRDVHSYCKPFESRPGDEGDCLAPYDIFPGIIDLTFGRDEAVTAGSLSGWLFRVEGVYPLPWYQGIHVFGSIYTKLQRNRDSQPFGPYTIVTPQEGAATDLNTFRFPLKPLDRDYFRLGIGVDLIQVFKKTGQPNKNAPQAPTTEK